MPNAYDLAREQYANLGVDAESALKTLAQTPISLQCWQGDDVGGFERAGAEVTGGIQATGNYPGKARTPRELRSDLETALGLIPGRHRVNLHANYAELGGAKIDRNAYTISHFAGWIDWARGQKIGLDFNPTYSRIRCRPAVTPSRTATRACANSGSSMASLAAGSPRAWASNSAIR